MSWDLTLALALMAAPLLINVWSGRRLSLRADDPAIAERWVAHNRNALLVSLAGAMVGFLIGELAVWAWLPWYLCYLLSLYPGRRGVLGETWSILGYLRFNLRIVAAFTGFWLLLGAAPAFARASSSYAWYTALGLSAVLLLWSHRFTDITLHLLAARPLDDPALQARFAQVLARASCSRPTVHRMDVRGGVFVNAFALPSRRMHAVVLADSMLKQFTPDEVTAIFAHEVGHLEHHDTRVLRRLEWLTNSLIAASLVVTALVQTSEELGPLMLLGWFCATLSVVVLRAAQNRKHEHESDLRAVELCGDGEALISALTKLHVFNRLPRRYAAITEASASHPSLARRIRAIRDAMNPRQEAAQDADFEPVAFRDPKRLDRFVVIEPARILWLEGVPPGTDSHPAALKQAARTTEALAYAHLAELHVRAALLGPRLVATDRDGRARAMALDPADVRAVQATLDRVDTRLPSLPSSRPPATALAAWAAFVLLLPAAVHVDVLFAVPWIAVRCCECRAGSFCRWRAARRSRRHATAARARSACSRDCSRCFSSARAPSHSEPSSPRSRSPQAVRASKATRGTRASRARRRST